MRKWGRENQRKNKHKQVIRNRRWTCKRYGITLKQYDQLVIDQNDKCKICLCENNNGKRWFIDHDHETEKVRGLLCRFCNAGLGMFKDNQTNMKRAIEYLKGIL